MGSEFEIIIPKIVAVVSDNASAAHLTRMTLLQRLNEKDPETVRDAVKCSGFQIEMFNKRFFNSCSQ